MLQQVLADIEEHKECVSVWGADECGTGGCINCFGPGEQFGETIVDIRSVSDDVQVEYAGNIPAVSGSSNDNTSNTTGYGLFAARFLV